MRSQLALNEIWPRINSRRFKTIFRAFSKKCGYFGNKKNRFVLNELMAWDFMIFKEPKIRDEVFVSFSMKTSV